MDLRRRETWLVVWAYTLFFLAPLSIAGVGTATGLLYFTVAYHRARQPKFDPLPHWLLAAFLLLPLAAALSALVNPNPLGNLIGLRKEYAIFIPLALLPALGHVNRKRLLLAYAIPIIVMGAYAVIQHYWGVDWIRPEGRKLITQAREPASTVFHGKGSFSHHLTFAGFMAMNVPFFLAISLPERGAARYVFGLAFAMACLGTLASLGRSGWLGAAAGVLLLLLGFPRRLLLPLSALALMLALSGFALYGGWLKTVVPYENQPGVVKRLLMTSEHYDEERLYIWQAALLGIKERPLLGVGYGNDKKYTPEYRRQVSEATKFEFKIRPTTHVHNIYLQVAFELGIVGLLAYLYLFGSIFRWNRGWIRRSAENMGAERAVLAGAACALAASLVAGLFESNFFDAEVRTLTLIMMGLSLHAGLELRAKLAGK